MPDRTGCLRSFWSPASAKYVYDRYSVLEDVCAVVPRGKRTMVYSIHVDWVYQTPKSNVLHQWWGKRQKWTSGVCLCNLWLLMNIWNYLKSYMIFALDKCNNVIVVSWGITNRMSMCRFSYLNELSWAFWWFFWNCVYDVSEAPS